MVSISSINVRPAFADARRHTTSSADVGSWMRQRIRSTFGHARSKARVDLACPTSSDIA
jgi:hypothetical protein